LIQIGADREGEARTYLSTIPGVELGAGLVSVDSPTTSVELRYEDGVRQSERLAGRLDPWSWELLEPVLARADALYVNFISGFELELSTALRFRQHLSIPTYADLHSLFLAISPQGLRRPRSLESWESWAQSFDMVQMNEGEFGLATGVERDPWARAEKVMGQDLKLLVVTLGARGSAYLAQPGASWTSERRKWEHGDTMSLDRPVRGHVPAADQVPVGDPTGCGDVWGATFFSRLLAGDGLETAMSDSNSAAARNVSHVGAPGLHRHLMEARELGPGIG
jgi:sugar/nucleoside kinase (ribokinase family)